MSEKLFQLEKILKYYSENEIYAENFPDHNVNYFTIYQAALGRLNTAYYPHIGSGLSALSEERGIYTSHNKDHFDDVVKYSGMLILGKDWEGDHVQLIKNGVGITPYELFILLMAIRVHDAGNIYGRERHEESCFKIIKDISSLDGYEAKFIGDIASAHGGKIGEDKDKISRLNEELVNCSARFRPRLLAAILRFADELCETRKRTSKVLMEHIPRENQVYHKYSESIIYSSINHEPTRVQIGYQIDEESATALWGCENRTENPGALGEVLLTSEIFDRLEKMDRERRYCNRFTREVYYISSIRATLDIVSNENRDVVHEIKIPELQDAGYPEAGANALNAIKTQYNSIEKLKKHLKRNK